jgi:two-component system, OmpR family, response regulator MprA
MGGGRILVVDDDLVTREALGRQLAAAGYEVRLAADGVAALAALGAWRPDLIVTDLVMPLVLGEQLIRRVRARPESAATPVVVLTGFKAAFADAALQAGATQVLEKPADLPRVAEVVGWLLGGGAP